MRPRSSRGRKERARSEMEGVAASLTLTAAPRVRSHTPSVTAYWSPDSRDAPRTSRRVRETGHARGAEAEVCAGVGGSEGSTGRPSGATSRTPSGVTSPVARRREEEERRRFDATSPRDDVDEDAPARRARRAARRGEGRCVADSATRDMPSDDVEMRGSVWNLREEPARPGVATPTAPGVLFSSRHTKSRRSSRARKI